MHACFITFKYLSTVLCKFIDILLDKQYSKILNNKHLTTTNVPTKLSYCPALVKKNIFLLTVSFSSEGSKNTLKDHFVFHMKLILIQT